MKETENVPFDLMPSLIRGSFLTKEQVEKLKEPFKDVASVVRCNDCIHWDRHTEECSNPDSVCFRNGWCKPDWYCADGERRSDNA